jgi:hypothetical protein
MDLAIYMIYAPSQVLKLERFSMRRPMDGHAWVLIWELKGCNEEIFQSISFQSLMLGYDSNFEIT